MYLKAAAMRKAVLALALFGAVAQEALDEARAEPNSAYAYCRGWWSEDLSVEYFSAVFPTFAAPDAELEQFKSYMANTNQLSDFHAGVCYNEVGSEADVQQYRSNKINHESSGYRVIDTGWHP